MVAGEMFDGELPCVRDDAEADFARGRSPTQSSRCSFWMNSPLHHSTTLSIHQIVPLTMIFVTNGVLLTVAG
jgi:hypothetical protein